MKFSLTVDSPREAGYATSMFQALQAAMTADPPPVVQFSQTRFGDVSHTVLTGGEFPSTGIASSSPFQVNVPTTATDTAEARDQEDDTSTDAAGTGAGTAPTTERKKRGPKSAAEKAAIAAAKAAAEENALKPGAALQGVSAQSLAQALQAMPLVYEGDGMQVRTAPDTPAEDVAAMRERLQAQEAKIKAEEEAAAAAHVAKDAAAAAKAAAQAAKDAKAATTVSPLLALVDTPAAATPPVTAKPAVDDDDILASLLRMKQPPVQQQVEPAGSRFAALSGQDLRKAFVEYINGEVGLLWARNVMEHYRLVAMEDLTDAQTREALEQPERFRSAA
jgi:hypothetical protein